MCFCVYMGYGTSVCDDDNAKMLIPSKFFSEKNQYIFLIYLRIFVYSQYYRLNKKKNESF